MQQAGEIREGMQVYGSDGQLVGTVEALHGDGFHVNGRHISRGVVARVAEGRIHLTEAAASYGSAGTDRTAGEMRVPLAEERLNVEKREAELGTVQVRKTVTAEEQTVPVELRREDVRVEERPVGERPLRPGEDAFQGETLQIPLRGEEAVVTKETVVTGEAVIAKEQTVEQEQISETVRKQRVELDEQSQQSLAGAGASEKTRAYTLPDGREMRVGMEVTGSDGTRVGQVKEVRADDFLLDRPMARDVYAPHSAIADVREDTVVLNIPAGEVAGMGWPNPPLL